MSENPLAQYFRKPAIHLELPSKGEFYPENVLTLPESGEAPILPMTALDEITYKTPDALFNGSAVADVIKSCVPCITDPWQMPTVDLNIVLTAIRIATLGHLMTIESMCPKCQEISEYEVDLRKYVENTPDVSLYNNPLNIGDLQVNFRPLLYKEVNESNKIQFDEEQLKKVLVNDDVSKEDKIKLLSDAFKDIAKFSVDSITRSIASIRTPETLVDDPDHIKEFLSNTKGDIYESIKDRLRALKKIEDLDDLELQCMEEECSHEYNQSFTLDMTSFFERNS